MGEPLTLGGVVKGGVVVGHELKVSGRVFLEGQDVVCPLMVPHKHIITPAIPMS